MSEFHRQPFGQPTYIEVSANGSSSGLDHYEHLDGAHLFHEPNYRTLPQPLQLVVPQESHAHGPYPFASHSSGVSLPGLQYTSPTMTGNPVPQQYDHEPSFLEELNGFSPITPNYNIGAYRTPYPDSNTSATSSATSPDPAAASLMADPVIAEADEDKRKRNQAASARFRQKKKQREQQLAESSREMQERTKKLEAENDGLKKENQFLKKLLVEKVDHMTDDDRDMLRKVANDALQGKK